MAIDLISDLGFDKDSKEVIQARELVSVYERLIDSLVQGREECDIKQKEVAKRMGTSQSAISDLENRNSDARFSTILRYAQAIGAEIEIAVSSPLKAMRSHKPDWVTLRVDALEEKQRKVIPMRPKAWQRNLKIEKRLVPEEVAA